MTENMIYYDANAGMKIHGKDIQILLDGVWTHLADVVFYDSAKGFILTKTAFYVPEGLKPNAS